MQEARARTDGRTLRSQRTREAIVDATISLLEEGDLKPTAPRVAARAKVSVRSVFQHFADLEELHAAVAERLVERVALLVVPVDPSIPRDERLRRFVRQRCALLEAVTPIRRAADVHGPFSVEITRRLRDGHAFLRAEIEHTFAPEIAADLASTGSEAALLDCLDAVLSWSTWQGLRALGRGHEEAERTVGRLVEAVLSTG